MQDADIEQRFHLMQKEVEATISLMKEAKLDLMAAIDSLRIEMEVFKTYMERYHPGFSESYPKLREEAIQSIDPEWMGSPVEKKI
jgi:formiminotetrahydrofolate cyclodeaminase